MRASGESPDIMCADSATIELRASELSELAAFGDMENAVDTAEFILPYTLGKHQAEFARDEITYLSIYRGSSLVGYFILVRETDGRSVEFRRIVVAAKGEGIGQVAIRQMESWCRDQLGCERIWLDVFDFNRRGQHIYRKLGYRQFDSTELDGKLLLLFEKSLL